MKFKKLLSLACVAIMAVSSMSISAFATELDADITDIEQLAYMDYDSASPAMKDRIIDARVAVAYNGDKSWTVGGQLGTIDEDGNLVPCPEFSDVFPDWDFSIIDARYQELTKSNDLHSGSFNGQVSPTSIGDYYYDNYYYIPAASDTTVANTFVTFVSTSSFDYLNGYVTDFSGGSANFGIIRDNVSLGYVTVNTGQVWTTSNIRGSSYSIRVSTYGNPGNGLIRVYAATEEGEK